MKTGIIKTAICDFRYFRQYPMDEIWDSLHLPQSDDIQLECYKPMIRLFSRIIQIHNKEKLDKLFFNQREHQFYVEYFFSRFEINPDEEIKESKLRKDGGFSFWCLFNVFAMIKNIESLNGLCSFVPIKPIWEIEVKDFKEALEKIVKPTDKYRSIWYRCRHERVLGICEGEICHKYNIMLIYYIMNTRTLGFNIEKQVTIDEIRDCAERYISNIPWPDEKIVVDVAKEKSEGIEMVAIYELIQAYYCLPLN